MNNGINEVTVRQAAQDFGFDAVAITTAAAPDHNDYHRSWLDAGMQGEMGYLQNRAELRSGPLSSPNLLADAQSVIMVALSYHFATERPHDTATARGTVARYARGQDYHTIFWEKLRAFGAWMEQTFPGTKTRGFCDSGPIRERELAARAGLGWQGKHTNLISLDLGNWFFLGALLTTLPLQPDGPVEDHCGTCTRCLAACPTGALVAPLTLDARRCISYLTIEHRGPIPPALRPLMGDRIFGCDDCLAACPWNERARLGQEMRLAARADDAAYPDLLHWLALLADETAFKQKFAGTPLLRPKREGLRRNVCIALGNIADKSAVDALGDVLQTEASPTVRGAAAWALGQVARRTGDTSALQPLLRAVSTETDADALEEMATALSAGQTGETR